MSSSTRSRTSATPARERRIESPGSLIMHTHGTPPFRADHVGSLLRPPYLLEARERRKANQIGSAELREVEDRAIREAVQLQENLGLQGITDGEFRRTYFHIDFLEQLEGVEVRAGTTAHFHGAAGEVDFAPPVLHVTGKVRHVKPIQLADFEFLKSVTQRLPKVTIPSPTMLHFRGGGAGGSGAAHPGPGALFSGGPPSSPRGT